MSEVVEHEEQAAPPEGWYEDPIDASRQRWWNGTTWTDHLIESATGVAPAAAQTALEAEPAERPYVPMASYDEPDWSIAKDNGLRRHESANTLAIWLIACSPIIFFVLELILYVLVPSILGGPTWGITLGTVVLLFGGAIWDNAALKKRGLPAASWLWMFLTLLGYFIARRVVLKRFGVRSNSPGNVFVLLSIGLAVGVYFFVANTVPAMRDTLAIQTLERQIVQELRTQSSKDWSVSCPEDAPASTVGATFTCKATETETGTVIEILARVVEPDRFSVSVKPAESNS